MTADEMRRAAEYLTEQARMYRAARAPVAATERSILAAKLRAMADADAGWQPIETAPSDGTEIDVWCADQHGEGYRVPNAWWDAVREKWRCYFDESLTWVHQPTFWRPSPPPPEAKS